MSDETVEKWLDKAARDLQVARLAAAADVPVTDMACYHVQQCVEKLLKAWLIACGHGIRRTHNISILVEQCIEIDDSFSVLVDNEIGRLTDYAIEGRYPGDWAIPSIEETEQAISMAEHVDKFVRKKISAGSDHTTENGK